MLLCLMVLLQVAGLASGGIGTFSGVNADNYRDDGSVIRQIYSGKTRIDRHEELIEYGIKEVLNKLK